MSEYEKGLVEISENFNSSEIIKESLNKMTKQHRKVGKISTPKGLVKKRQGFDYVELSYMKSIANEQFPGWSWTIINSEALGGAAYVVHGRLKWFDNGVWREGDMVAAHRIQTKKGGTTMKKIRTLQEAKEDYYVEGEHTDEGVIKNPKLKKK